ncbi:MAG: ribonuclease HIII [Bacilli bacterium]|nr:ribonuclease HIII [Bacilli bacterium]
MKAKTNSYTMTPNAETLNKIKAFYAPMAEAPTNEYMEFFYRDEGVTVSVYKPNKKGVTKVLFQGERAVSEAMIWDLNVISEIAKEEAEAKKTTATIPNRYPQIGSDEVGTGDFFGPICVCAALVKESDLALLNELGVTDSKKMNDSYIREIGPTLVSKFDYSQLSLPNEKFNEVHDEFNMNAIKAKLHNRAVLNLLDKHSGAYIYQDQFAEEGLYYKYLKDEEKVARGIIFATKGESQFPSVALGSVIARYSFLKKMDSLNEKYHMTFPLGAGEAVDEFAKEFVARFGIEELKKVAKTNFANFKKLI